MLIPAIVIATVSALLTIIYSSLTWLDRFEPCSTDFNFSARQPKADLPLECFFSLTYEQARQKFLSEVHAAGASVETFSLPVIDDYVTDVAIFRGNNEKFLVHISGTHGPEGFAGSAAQAAGVKFLVDNGVYADESIDKSELPTVVLVHALNPYGMANNRRNNEHNIDLNRNFLTPAEFSEKRNRDPNFLGAVEMDAFLNPKSKLFPGTYPLMLLNDIYTAGNVVYGLIQYGALAIKRAMVSGQYHDKQKIFFGGDELSTSAKNLIGLVEKLGIPDNATHVTLIDVHTGLGPAGVDTLLLDGDADMQVYIGTYTLLVYLWGSWPI
jgi:hypothetical protein